MSGIAVIVAGMFIGVPAALLLVVTMGVSLAARAAATERPWHRPYVHAMTVVIPLLALVYPLSMLVFGAGSKMWDFFEVALLFDIPVLVLAVIALVLALRVTWRRA